jgi:hypothetical protein
MRILNLLTAFAVLILFSCNKDENSDKIFIKYKLDGEKQEFTATQTSINTGFGADASSCSGIFNFEDDISICLSMDQDSITAKDFENLVGEKLKVRSCGGVGCGTGADFDVKIDGEYFTTTASNNPYPDYYIRFNEVRFFRTLTIFDDPVNEYFIEGDFHVQKSIGFYLYVCVHNLFYLYENRSSAES